MKGFAKIALTVALLAIIVLSIVVASVAWFTSNNEVDANDVTLGSARTLNVSFDPLSKSSGYEYGGQPGNVASGEDAPYIYEAGSFHVGISPSGNGKYGTIKVEFGMVTVTRAPSVQDNATGTISNVLITDLFHVTATIKEDGINKPTYNITIGDDGMVSAVLDNNENQVNAYPVQHGIALFPEGGYTLSFTYTFLPETAYSAWEAAVAGEGSFNDIVGYERVGNGSHIGVVDYVPYKAKYHYGLQRYDKSQTADGNGDYTYTPSENGGYVRVIDNYLTNVDKYNVTFTPSDSGDYYKDPNTETYISAANATEAEKANGTRGSISVASGTNCIKVGDSGDYVALSKYNAINGFPYSNDRYRGETFTFAVNCSVEEVSYDTQQ